MAQHNETGNKGEELAARYLRGKGYSIIEQNWRHSHLEIDIIAKIGFDIVFVEVKTLRNTSHGFPEQAVTRKKAENLFKAATAYLEDNKLDNEIRFDIISILITKGKTEIRHIEDGISPFPLL
ncbi:YraN family protein [bacterium]|nr:YraN family protein [bacterium]